MEHPLVQYSTAAQRESGIWFPNTEWYDDYIGYYGVSNFWIPPILGFSFVIGCYVLTLGLYFSE